MNHLWNKIHRAWLCLSLMLCLLSGPLQVCAVAQTGLEGKTLSILGDSISTYAGISNNAGHNRTIGGNAVCYTPGFEGIYRQDTWWQQTVDRLGMRLLVNNSWSGSCMFMTGAGTPGAYETRCVQLHSSNGRVPDIIAIFMGTNDQDYFADSIGTYESIDFESLITWTETGYRYAVPTTCMEAYAITLHKISQRYPNAEVYCFTLLQRPVFTPFSVLSFNEELTKLAGHYGVYVVDLMHCGVYAQEDAYDMLMADYVHPNAAGMDAITGAFVDSILTNSRYVSEDTAMCRVEYSLKGVVVRQGTAHTLLWGEPLDVELVSTTDRAELDISVTMDGVDITAQACRGGRILIASVTADLQICAAAREPIDRWYPRWEPYLPSDVLT